jgi:hypothetical protein
MARRGHFEADGIAVSKSAASISLVERSTKANRCSKTFGILNLKVLELAETTG